MNLISIILVLMVIVIVSIGEIREQRYRKQMEKKFNNLLSGNEQYKLLEKRLILFGKLLGLQQMPSIPYELPNPMDGGVAPVDLICIDKLPIVQQRAFVLWVGEAIFSMDGDEDSRYAYYTSYEEWYQLWIKGQIV